MPQMGTGQRSRSERSVQREVGARSAHRNGGRHCCQPPLRRAKDMPVFVTWSPENPKAPKNPLSILTHQLRRRFRSGISLFREAWLIYCTAPPEGSLVLQPAWPGWNRDPNQTHPIFRGPSWETLYRVPLRSPEFRRKPGAASRDRKISLPAPLTDWSWTEPESSNHRLPAEIGPLVTCRTLPRRCRPFRGGRDRRPDHLITMHI